MINDVAIGSNNTNKLSPQELCRFHHLQQYRSNNTNKLSPQELQKGTIHLLSGSNNTNKLSPQELYLPAAITSFVQIIQINLALKNLFIFKRGCLKFK